MKTSLFRGQEVVNTWYARMPKNRNRYHASNPFRLSSLAWAVPEAGGTAVKNWLNHISKVQLPPENLSLNIVVDENVPLHDKEGVSKRNVAMTDNVPWNGREVVNKQLNTENRTRCHESTHFDLRPSPGPFLMLRALS